MSAAYWRPGMAEWPLNAYGQAIVPPEYFDGAHVANPGPAGLPPVCACGWTPHGRFTMADHLADMRDGGGIVAPTPTRAGAFKGGGAS